MSLPRSPAESTVEPASSRTDAVLAAIDGTLDGGDDAMRWSPEPRRTPVQPEGRRCGIPGCHRE